uniref:Testis-specific Y-encoded protein 1-like n=1 Tax=Bos mutus grunniens TaxID=30521 RepID=A0A8B9WYY8_BOSMU
VEAVEEGEALVDGDVAGIGREFQLLAEDIMEEVEVVADEEQEQRPSQELEEKTVEEQGQERPGGPCERQELDAVQALAALQVELSSEREQNRRAYVQFMRKNHQRRKRHLARRSAIIQGIPGFWAKAVSFALHPQVSVMISDQDKDLLSYKINLKVSEGNRMLIFSFRDNPYSWNTVIIKEYFLENTGYRAYCSSPVHLSWDFEWGAPSSRLDTRSLKFLNCLSGHNCPESNRIAEVGFLWACIQLERRCEKPEEEARGISSPDLVGH